MLQRNANGVIQTMFFGELNYDTDTFRLFPLRGIVDGTFNESEEVIGTITAQFGANGNPTVSPQQTRSGNFQITTQGGLPSGAPSTGRFLVFRV